MKIQRLFVSHYKNLVDCEIFPTGLHAITGCNSSGKSNLLEIFPFIATLISGSDETRSRLLKHGFSPNEGIWFPLAANTLDPQPFRFEISVHLEVLDQPWQVDYELEIAAATYSEPWLYPEGSGKLSLERLSAKQIGKPGKPRTLIERTGESNTTVYFEKETRKKEVYKTRQDMSALQSLAVRQAEDFPLNFPVVANFTHKLLNSSLVRLDPESFSKTLKDPIRRPQEAKRPGEIVLTYEPFTLLMEIKNDKQKWIQFQYWLKELGEIDDVHLIGAENDLSKDKIDKSIAILTRQNDRPQMPQELSMGNTVILGTLIAIYSSLNTGGAILFEEPENHLHPQAIEKLIRLFREFSDKQNIIFSTHSPVVLNSLLPQEVTVMRPLDQGFVTTQKVADIQEAIDALNRGFLSMGDLLQSNFKNE